MEWGFSLGSLFGVGVCFTHCYIRQFTSKQHFEHLGTVGFILWPTVLNKLFPLPCTLCDVHPCKRSTRRTGCTSTSHNVIFSSLKQTPATGRHGCVRLQGHWKLRRNISWEETRKLLIYKADAIYHSKAPDVSYVTTAITAVFLTCA
jgi:hypothetical protein